jgi:hypothetical protein
LTTLADFGLSTDPFSLIVQDELVHHWAGRPREKEHLLDVIESVRVSDIGTSEFVIVHGEYGAGKSHALRYLTTQINVDKNAHFKGKAIYLSTVRVSQKVTFLDVYKSVLDVLGTKFLNELAVIVHGKVHAAAATLVQAMPPHEAASLLQQGNQLIEQTLGRWVPANLRMMVELLLKLKDGAPSALRYLRGEKVSAQEVQELGMNSPIDDDFSAVSALASLFRVMCLSINGQAPAYEAVYLFIDEQENLVDMKAVESGQLLQSFRELLNQLPQNFCMIWGATADAALIEAVLPASILQRLTRKYIELSDLLPEDAKEFLKQHLSDLRVQGFAVPQPFHPFSEAAIDLVIERTVGLTPRSMFRSLRAVLERAIRRHDLKAGEEIDAALAQEILELIA